MDNYPKEYTRRYWKEVQQEAISELREELGIEGDTVKLAWNLGLGSFLVFLIVVLIGTSLANQTLGLLNKSAIDIVLYVIGTLFFADVVGLLINNYAGIPLTAFFQRRYIVAAKRDYEKTKTIDELSPDTLKLNVEVPTIYQIVDSDGNSFEETVLSITNSNDKNRIIKLESKFNFIDQFFMPPDNSGMASSRWEDLEGIWVDGKTEIELEPGHEEILKIGYLDPKPPHGIHLGRGGLTGTLFEYESVFRYQIKFQGRYEKEWEYRNFLYDGVIYSKPSQGRLVGGQQALNRYNDIPNDLLIVIKDVIEKKAKDEEIEK